MLRPYYPQAAIVGGWATRQDFLRQEPRRDRPIIRGWVERNDYIIRTRTRRSTRCRRTITSRSRSPTSRSKYAAQKMFASGEWRKMYADGTVTKWLQQVTDFFVRFGNIQNPVPASQYFDTKPYLDTVKA
jgi:NitT/TauT family transport system substrate-binding protein